MICKHNRFKAVFIIISLPSKLNQKWSRTKSGNKKSENKKLFVEHSDSTCHAIFVDGTSTGGNMFILISLLLVVSTVKYNGGSFLYSFLEFIVFWLNVFVAKKRWSSSITLDLKVDSVLSYFNVLWATVGGNWKCVSEQWRFKRCCPGIYRFLCCGNVPAHKNKALIDVTNRQCGRRFRHTYTWDN